MSKPKATEHRDVKRARGMVDTTAKWDKSSGLYDRLVALVLRAKAEEAERADMVTKKSLKRRAAELRRLADEVEKNG